MSFCSLTPPKHEETSSYLTLTSRTRLKVASVHTACAEHLQFFCYWPLIRAKGGLRKQHVCSLVWLLLQQSSSLWHLFNSGSRVSSLGPFPGPVLTCGCDSRWYRAAIHRAFSRLWLTRDVQQSLCCSLVLAQTREGEGGSRKEKDEMF